MTLIDLLKRMYLIRETISGCYNTQSEIYSFVQSYQDKELVLAFSQNFRELLTRNHPIFDKDAHNRLTTRFALYLDVFMQLDQGNLEPMLLYLIKHRDVAVFLVSHWAILENLYYDFKSQSNDIILLEEYSLLLNEEFQVLRVDLIKDNIKMSHEPFKKEFLHGFFKNTDDPFLGKNQKEREKFKETMNSFFTSFHV